MLITGCELFLFLLQSWSSLHLHINSTKTNIFSFLRLPILILCILLSSHFDWKFRNSLIMSSSLMFLLYKLKGENKSKSRSWDHGDSLSCRLVNSSGNFQTKSMPDGIVVCCVFLFSAYALCYQEGKVQHWNTEEKCQASQSSCFILKQKKFPLNSKALNDSLSEYLSSSYCKLLSTEARKAI